MCRRRSAAQTGMWLKCEADQLRNTRMGPRQIHGFVTRWGKALETHSCSRRGIIRVDWRIPVLLLGLCPHQHHLIKLLQRCFPIQDLWWTPLPRGWKLFKFRTRKMHLREAPRWRCFRIISIKFFSLLRTQGNFSFPFTLHLRTFENISF